MTASILPARIAYGVGLLAFVGAAVLPTTPNQASDADGTAIVDWTPGMLTQANLALEPVVQVARYVTAVRDPNEVGDGFEASQAVAAERAVVSFPAAVGWFGIVGSALMFPFWLGGLGRQARVAARAVGVWVAGSAVLVARDLGDAATVWSGHFHLGAGGYLIVAAYVLVGGALAAGVVPERGSPEL